MYICIIQIVHIYLLVYIIYTYSYLLLNTFVYVCTWYIYTHIDGYVFGIEGIYSYRSGVAMVLWALRASRTFSEAGGPHRVLASVLTSGVLWVLTLDQAGLRHGVGCASTHAKLSSPLVPMAGKAPTRWRASGVAELTSSSPSGFWIDSDNDVAYDQGTLGSHVETEEWWGLLIGHPCDSAVFVKGNAIRQTGPECA